MELPYRHFYYRITDRQRLLFSDLAIIDGNLCLDTRLNGDASHLLDDIRRSMEIDQTLVDAHFETIPSVGTFSARSLTGGDSQLFGWKADGATDMELLVQRGLLQVGADLLQVLHVATGQGDADAMDDFVRWHGTGFFLGWEGHDETKDTSD